MPKYFDLEKLVSRAWADLPIAEEKRRQERFKESIGTYEELIGGQREKLLAGFRTGTETGVARQLEATTRAAQLRAQRAGLGRGGMGGRGMAVAEAGLRGQGQAQMQEFSTKLAMLQSQQREAFIRGEFDFMHNMERMVAEQDFEESMIRLRAQLQRDQESRNAMYGLAGSIGGFLAGGPIGTAVGGYIGGQLGGQGQQQTVYGGRSLY